jgi:hypothetical protein
LGRICESEFIHTEFMHLLPMDNKSILLTIDG